jgi:hypothetical protein
MTAKVHVFVGPTLAGVARPGAEDFVFHGPVAKGDVYRLIAGRPLAIGIIDGYFERVPAVWHKEILWALSEGVHVFGAASMGALRAAELAPFGMVGVGRIFADFASGRLTDDDEVTIAHADPSLGYRPVSEAMVNIRATLDAAERLGLLDPAERQELVARAKSQFYADRSYAALLPFARTLLGARGERFSRWLRDPTHHVDQKKLDALELLHALAEQRDARAEPRRVPWTFQHTDAWEQVRLSFARPDARPSERPRFGASEPQRVPTSERALLMEQARLRALEVRSAKRDGYRPSERDLALARSEFQKARGLEEPERLLEFLEQQGLSVSEFERLMADEACVRHARLVPEYDLECELADLELLVGPERHRTSPPESERRARSRELETKRPAAIRLRVGP